MSNNVEIETIMYMLIVATAFRAILLGIIIFYWFLIRIYKALYIPA